MRKWEDLYDGYSVFGKKEICIFNLFFLRFKCRNMYGVNLDVFNYYLVVVIGIGIFKISCY